MKLVIDIGGEKSWLEFSLEALLYIQKRAPFLVEKRSADYFLDKEECKLETLKERKSQANRRRWCDSHRLPSGEYLAFTTNSYTANAVRAHWAVVEAVEVLKEKANDDDEDLRIVEIPDGTLYAVCFDQNDKTEYVQEIAGVWRFMYGTTVDYSRKEKNSSGTIHTGGGFFGCPEEWTKKPTCPFFAYDPVFKASIDELLGCYKCNAVKYANRERYQFRKCHKICDEKLINQICEAENG